MKILTTSLAICAVLISGGAAQAAILEEDLYQPGDHLITADSVTGLEWLDLTQTVNLSYNQVNSGVGGWLNQGFRHATADEVYTLIFNAGLGSLYHSGQTNLTSSDIMNLNQFISMLGDVASFYTAVANRRVMAVGIVDKSRWLATTGQGEDSWTFQEGSLEAKAIAEVGYDIPLGIGGAWVPGQDGTIGGAWTLGLNDPYPQYLVRTTEVPVPATAWLFGSGLIGLIRVARRKAT
ncbi:VPLPA-CTERM sorting domain-containing protein [Sulfurirhabdus autotrophica]|uniref:Putative secreted protein n=1 Tax=Sulfurirhabdus autotrophica TaxID=1706046 RepID=A0A4R3YEP4_9PROT|nr:VPLPA-CTERM sorting domain-containing protein [Sulfurirhabdus autotrophica]TCV90550.1 putative secreted protein [Sulfurirhabdus autotrophica]